MLENTVNLFRHYLVFTGIQRRIRASIPRGIHSKKIPAALCGRACPRSIRILPRSRLHPFESALPVKPDVTDDQDAQEHKHAHQSVLRSQTETFLPGGK